MVLRMPSTATTASITRAFEGRIPVARCPPASSGGARTGLINGHAARQCPHRPGPPAARPEVYCPHPTYETSCGTMCGIAGIVGSESSYLADVSEIRRMCQTIAHRGPDDEGVRVSGRVGLGMRRLSIIDLSTGCQPIHNEDRTVWIVFNGEIYNFPELRARLEARGHHFYTNTDTEVIVHLYEDHGSDCVQQLRGMFAFALWDEDRQCLLLARDRFGKKPLHYAIHGGRLLFGSEIKTLLAVDPTLVDVHLEGLVNFFYFGYIPDPLTAFRRIQKLPPGHLLEFNNGRTLSRPYWVLPEYGVHDPNSEEECLEELEQRLEEAVKIRLISDVPLGALLSGGVDSSTVVALM